MNENKNYYKLKNENEKSCRLKWHKLHLVKPHHQDCVQQLDHYLTAVQLTSADMAPAMPQFSCLETEVDRLQITTCLAYVAI